MTGTGTRWAPESRIVGVTTVDAPLNAREAGKAGGVAPGEQVDQRQPLDDLPRALATSAAGLSTAEATRLARYGANETHPSPCAPVAWFAGSKGTRL